MAEFGRCIFPWTMISFLDGLGGWDGGRVAFVIVCVQYPDLLRNRYNRNRISDE